MPKRKWTALLLAGAMLLSVGTCASDLATSVANTVIDSLPDLINAWLAGSTGTT